MRASGGRPHELEQQVLASLGLDEGQLRELGRSAPGTRRDLVLRPEGLRWQFLDAGAGGEESAAGESTSLVVEFGLPAGAYASLVIRALTRQDPWLGAAREADEREESAGAEHSESAHGHAGQEQ
jgi:tRNA(Glu) U13 pseudouridine synthase TruD